MAIVLTPLASSLTPGPVVCTDFLSLSANDAISASNCPVVTKSRSVIIDQGRASSINWEFRDAAGRAVDISSCSGSLGAVQVKFRNIFEDCGASIYTVEAAVVDASAGIVSFTPPTAVVDNPGIYIMSIGLVSLSEQLIGLNSGFLSVERSLFGSQLPGVKGPLTLGEIRIQMRDTAIENDLHDRVEFDDMEIVHSVVQPIRYWNEVPPPVSTFTASNFPFHYHWLRATCGNLLRIAATWYMRNKLQVTHGGAQDDERNRDNAYLQLSELYRQEWEGFVRDKKLEINAGLFFGYFV